MKITCEILRAIYPSATMDNCIKYAASINEAMQRFKIDTTNRQRAFLAQIGHESGQLRYCIENLNYDAVGLMRVFSKYFPTRDIADQYARNPEKIANRVYASRMGNGDQASGDGWRFRGRGLIQLTGKDNYRAVGLGLGVDLVAAPDKLLTPEYATLSAAWFWASKGMNTLADGLGGRDDEKVFESITRRINGGTNGQADRVAIYERAKKVIWR